MVSEFFLNIIFGIVSGFFAMLPDFSWTVNSTSFQYFLSILQVAGYVFPWPTVVAIASLIVGLSIFRVVIAFIKSIWDLFPFA